MSIKKWIKWDYSDIDDPNYKNELKANYALGIILLSMSIVGLICLILQGCNVFQLERHTEMVIFYAIAIFFSFTGFLIAFLTKGRKKYVKFALIFDLMIMAIILDMFLGYYAVLFLAVPLIGVSRYANKNNTLILAGTMAVLLLMNAFVAYFTNVELDANLVTNGGYWGYTKSYLAFVFLPKLLLFSIITLFCTINSISTSNFTKDATASIQKEERINGELNLARDLQKNMLPSVFPPFPNVKNFDIYAAMEPAKEVGGDLYDFFLIDEQHLGMVIADVSGKGVPASLFMGMTKILIKNMISDYDNIGVAMAKVNDILVDGNSIGQFVTAWVGILDLFSGELTYVNAGHNPPVLMKKGAPTYLEDKSGMSLGVIAHKMYKKFSIKLEPTDRLFLYTDGVTEATDPNNVLYGEKRLLKFLKEHKKDDDTTLVNSLLNELATYHQNQEKADDITMVSMTFNSYLDKKNVRKEFVATVENFTAVSEFIEDTLCNFNVSLKYINQINIAVEEIFTNIAKYGFKGLDNGKATIDISFCNQIVTITTYDNSPKFDPFARKDPDITLGADDRPIGGLGLLMVKKLMDEVGYKYENNTNIITLVKKVY